MDLLQIMQVTSAVIVIILILLQRSDAGVGGAFGGGDSESSGHTKRRGPEKVIFVLSILFALLFLGLVIYQFIAR